MAKLLVILLVTGAAVGIFLGKTLTGESEVSEDGSVTFTSGMGTITVPPDYDGVLIPEGVLEKARSEK